MVYFLIPFFGFGHRPHMSTLAAELKSTRDMLLQIHVK